ncbi:MAG: sodium/solute symporter [Acidobacteria bacterium]|nr:sodium/solute symporter [Acidobacteriota bacterium]
MSAALLNWIVVGGYFALTIWLGERVGRRGAGVDEYFLAGRGMPWWAAAFSIVGTETSTLTFVGVPAIAYAGNLTFLQVALGYVVGRFVVAALLVPRYFDGRVRTAYEIIGARFGDGARRVTSGVFLVSRLLADGVRLFATALVLQTMLPLPLSAAVVGILAITLLYTVRGGLRAVIWNDAVQLAVYVGGAILALAVLTQRLPQGLTATLAELGASDKLRLLDLGWDWGNPYTFWSGVIGGAVLTMATHGTDQMFVQRLLACADRQAARRAVIVSGVLVFAQMALFLVIGTYLFAFYELNPPALAFASNDQIFPRFIVDELPMGLAGLVIAAVFAAAMSTLSSSMSSVASAVTLDFGKPGQQGETASLRLSYIATAAAAVSLAIVAWLAQSWGSVLEAGLTITSVTFGGVLGVFLLVALGVRLPGAAMTTAMVAGQLTALALQQAGGLAWTWLTPAGAAVTVLLGVLIGGVARRSG